MILVDCKAPWAKGRVFDNLALDPSGLTLRRVAQGLQLRDELVDLLHRGSGCSLQHGVDGFSHGLGRIGSDAA
jgi:hypothetical protein